MSTGLIVFLVIGGVIACLALVAVSIIDMVRVLLWLEDKPDATFKEFLRACLMGIPAEPTAPKVIHEGNLAKSEILTVPATPAGDCSALCCSDFTFTKLVFADGREIFLPGQHQPEVGKRLRVIEDGGKHLFEECAPHK